MFTVKPEHRWFLIIGVTFSISLITLSFFEESDAKVYTSTYDSNYKYYVNDESKVYIDFPASWTVTYPTYGVSFTGDGAALEIKRYNPTPGSWFPSSEIPIEQVAKLMYHNLNQKIDYQDFTTITHYKFPAYQLGYTQVQQEGESILVDKYILINGPYLYHIEYTSPESLYEQNKAIRDNMINSIVVGDKYEGFMFQKAAKLNDIGTEANEFAIGSLEGTTAATAAFNTERGETYDHADDCKNFDNNLPGCP